MKNKIYYIILATTLMLCGGCTDVMNKTNLGQLLADDIWEDPYMIKSFLDQIISDNLPKAVIQNNRNATEEHYDRYLDSKFMYNNYSINDLAGNWSYPAIRNINKFLENVDRCPSEKLSDDVKAQYKAQLLTLRGMLYFDMVRIYGGVPLILHEQSPEEDLYVSRAKTSECIAQIVQDFDDAIATPSFPLKWEGSDVGRINKAFAYVLKGRALLHYACPQFSKTIGAGAKSVDQRWQEAYAACREAKERLAEAGYRLFKPEPNGFDDAVQTFYELFFTEIPDNPEVVAVRRYVYPEFPLYEGDAARRPAVSGTTLGGRGSCALEFANAFLNADGTPYTGLEIPAGYGQNVELGRSTTAYWIGREPRFYATVAWNGCFWPLHRQAAFADDLDEAGRMRHHWAIQKQADPPFECFDVNESGAVCTRKMIDIDQCYFCPGGNNTGTSMDWILCRYAEVLLNFAETAVKTGHDAEAMAVLQAIRHRAGIPRGDNNYGLGNATGDALLVLILKERLLELALEGENDGFRFNDLRRWRLFTDDIAGYTVKGFVRHTIRPRLKNEELSNLIKPDNRNNCPALAELDLMNDPDSYFDLFEDCFYTLDDTPWSVGERQYFFHLPLDEQIRRNPKLEQTAGWEGGTFDPYL
jgi:hypothetical protein